MIRSVLSVLAGVVAWGLVWVSANQTLIALFPGSFDEAGGTRNAPLLLVILVLAAALSVGAGYLTATLARRAELKHALVLALVQLAIGIAVQVSAWELLPAWYHLVFLAILVPTHLVGGILRLERRPTRPSPA